MFALSQFVSTIAGSIVVKSVPPKKEDVRLSCNIFGGIAGAVAIILIIFNCGPFVFIENKKFEERLEELQP